MVQRRRVDTLVHRQAQGGEELEAEAAAASFAKGQECCAVRKRLSTGKPVFRLSCATILFWGGLMRWERKL